MTDIGSTRVSVVMDRFNEIEVAASFLRSLSGERESEVRRDGRLTMTELSMVAGMDVASAQASRSEDDSERTQAADFARARANALSLFDPARATEADPEAGLTRLGALYAHAADNLSSRDGRRDAEHRGEETIQFRVGAKPGPDLRALSGTSADLDAFLNNASALPADYIRAEPVRAIGLALGQGRDSGVAGYGVADVIRDRARDDASLPGAFESDVRTADLSPGASEQDGSDSIIPDAAPHVAVSVLLASLRVTSGAAVSGAFERAAFTASAPAPQPERARDASSPVLRALADRPLFR